MKSDSKLPVKKIHKCRGGKSVTHILYTHYCRADSMSLHQNFSALIYINCLNDRNHMAAIQLHCADSTTSCVRL